MTNFTPLDPFYPIVPDAAWLLRIAPLGVRTVQLRLKDQPADTIRRVIADCLTIARDHRIQLIVNDYWQDAIAAGADYIHLGQEDLATADLAAIKRAGLKLGISTHDDAERAIALAAQPDYIALGPVFPTTLKVMTWAPQGLDRVTTWKAAIGALPLVAIGGMTPARASATMAAGADSIAVITDFVTHADPEKRIAEWVAWSKAQTRSRQSAAY